MKKKRQQAVKSKATIIPMRASELKPGMVYIPRLPDFRRGEPRVITEIKRGKQGLDRNRLAVFTNGVGALPIHLHVNDSVLVERS